MKKGSYAGGRGASALQREAPCGGSVPPVVDARRGSEGRVATSEGSPRCSTWRQVASKTRAASPPAICPLPYFLQTT
ncbi:hypothetical protein QUB80_02165 [Chlorogloeopsis sp. ULAP01]|uniref:hypothetical protein n=1 Tax=Chlorogloeopsis sp. ULAP01 TaxID=3056483 RepID=UPI0025AAB5B9|nr:hypothetical protein [Chlorogloeopsis sp. ULAP01]MDM9379506.1 hypothetical protein [Chlorogloeopsis sp. ULAP01]